ncbi:ADM_collapsed_G0017420.mRNA.1.CDS.1 [Saccharomyces cerevisiae]|nr:ADM_collapsed_G0017420.mRNA.1.CDS.1 [Saccharomyces cerevisiae]
MIGFHIDYIEDGQRQNNNDTHSPYRYRSTVAMTGDDSESNVAVPTPNTSGNGYCHVDKHHKSVDILLPQVCMRKLIVAFISTSAT